MDRIGLAAYARFYEEIGEDGRAGAQAVGHVVDAEVGLDGREDLGAVFHGGRDAARPARIHLNTAGAGAVLGGMSNNLLDRLKTYQSAHPAANPAAQSLIWEAIKMIEEYDQKVVNLVADRDAGWRMAKAAAEGHDHCRELLIKIGEIFDRKVDDIDGLPEKVSDLKSSLEAVRYEAQCLRSEVVTLRGLLREQDEQIAEQIAKPTIPLGRSIPDAKVGQTILIDRPEQWTNETVWRLQARPDASNAVVFIGAEADRVALTLDVPGTYVVAGSCGEKRKHTLIRVPSMSTADFDPGENDDDALDFWRRRAEHMHRALATLLGAEPKVLDEVEDGRLLARLNEAFAAAGAPVGGGLAAWASDVRNTKLGQRAEIEELAGLLRDYRTAREHELAEFRAAADALPDVLKPTNGYPYSIMCASPIQVFMTLRERALALVNPTAVPPVSGA